MGHVNVDYRDIKDLAIDQFQGFATIAGRKDVIAKLAKVGTRGVTKVLFVIDNQQFDLVAVGQVH
jgi:hypothetical protein